MKIYIDENMPPQLARALNIIQDAVNHQQGTQFEVLSVVDEFGRGAKDEEWIPQVPGAIVITQDYRIQRTRHQRDLYEKHGLGMVYLKPSSKNGMSFWDMTKILINKWEDITGLATKKKFPFGVICRPGSGKLKEIE